MLSYSFNDCLQYIIIISGESITARTIKAENDTGDD